MTYLQTARELLTDAELDFLRYVRDRAGAELLYSDLTANSKKCYLVVKSFELVANTLFVAVSPLGFAVLDNLDTIIPLTDGELTTLEELIAGLQLAQVSAPALIRRKLAALDEPDEYGNQLRLTNAGKALMADHPQLFWSNETKLRHEVELLRDQRDAAVNELAALRAKYAALVAACLPILQVVQQTELTGMDYPGVTLWDGIKHKSPTVGVGDVFAFSHLKDIYNLLYGK